MRIATEDQPLRHRDTERRKRAISDAKLQEDEAAADAEGYGFGAGGSAELAEDGCYVEFGGVVGDV